MTKQPTLSLTMLQAIELFRAKEPQQWTGEELAAFRARLQESPILISSLGGQGVVDGRLAEVTAALSAPAIILPAGDISPVALPPRVRSKILWRAGEAAVFLVLLAGVCAAFIFLWRKGDSNPAPNVAEKSAVKDANTDANAPQSTPAHHENSVRKAVPEEPVPVETTDDHTWRNWNLSGPSDSQWNVRDDWDRTNPSNPQPVKLLSIERGPVTLARTSRIAADKHFLEINVRPLQTVSRAGHIVVRRENVMLADLAIGSGETKWPYYLSLENWADQEVSLQVEFTPGEPGQKIAFWGVEMVASKRQESRPESVLAEGLASKDPKTRLYSAKKAAQAGDLAALPALVETLHDKDAQIRRAAVAALLKFKDPRAREALRKTLGSDREPGLRVMVAAAFANQPVPDDIPALLTALKDPDVRVSKAAARAFADVRQVSVTTVLLTMLNDSDAKTREAGAAALSLQKGKAVEQALLSRLSGDAEIAVKTHAAFYFQSNPSAHAIAPLAALLKSENVALRRQVVRSLSANSGPDATRALALALEDADGEVRQGAATALSHRKSPVADAALLTALSASPDQAVKKQAIAHFQQFPNPLATGPLVAVLGNQDEALRRQAIRALAHSSDEAAIEALGKMLADSNPLRRVAINALRQSHHPKAAAVLKNASIPK